jgi:hypothetical protein
MERGQAEVVEQVVAQLEVGQLGARYQQEERASGTSRLRTVRQKDQAPSGSRSAATTAPVHPSGGSSRAAVSGEEAAFHG